MKNVTITLDEEVARWARVWAAEQDMSVSRFVGELLRQRMDAETAYDSAMHRYLAKPQTPLRQGGAPLPSRESLYDRSLFR